MFQLHLSDQQFFFANWGATYIRGFTIHITCTWYHSEWQMRFSDIYCGTSKLKIFGKLGFEDGAGWRSKRYNCTLIVLHSPMGVAIAWAMIPQSPRTWHEAKLPLKLKLNSNKHLNNLNIVINRISWWERLGNYQWTWYHLNCPDNCYTRCLLKFIIWILYCLHAIRCMRIPINSSSINDISNQYQSTKFI